MILGRLPPRVTLLIATLFGMGCGPSDGTPSTVPDAGADSASPATSTGGASGSGGATGTGGATATGSGGSLGSGGSAPMGSGGSAPVGSGGSSPVGSGGSAPAGTGGAIGTGGAVGGGTGSGGGPGGTGGRGGGSAGGVSGTGGRGSGGSPGTGGAPIGGAGGNLTVWLAGDSTVANGSSPCPIGWGAQFKANFNSRVTISNGAQGGRSLHTWLYSVLDTKDANGECNLTKDSSGKPVIQPAWKAMLDGMKAGDYLFIQFGINDGGDCPRYEGDATFRASLGMMAQAAKDRGAHPVFVTPVSSISCSGGTAQGTRGRFVTGTIGAGTEYGVPVLDLHMLSVALYNQRSFCPLPGGASDVSATTGGAVGAFFCDDHTHFSDAGAVDIGRLVANGIRSLNLPLAAYLN